MFSILSNQGSANQTCVESHLNPVRMDQGNDQNVIKERIRGQRDLRSLLAGM